MRAIKAEARPQDHDVSPVPGSEPRRSEILRGVRRSPHTRLPACGTEISPGKKFCRVCGTALSGRVPDCPLSPASYTPKHLAEKILTSKAALEGERKQVTVLFAHLKGT